MTREEAIAQLKMDRDLCNFNPMTGEEAPMNEDCRKSAEALDMAIKALEQQPCEDTISRQAAIDAFLTELTERERKNLLHTWSTVEVKYFVVDMLEKLPSAQLERKKGEWIPVTNGRGGFECDQCHNYAPSYQDGVEWLSAFCPNCGCRMEGEQE